MRKYFGVSRIYSVPGHCAAQPTSTLRQGGNLTAVGSFRVSLVVVRSFLWRLPLLGLFTSQGQHRIDFRRSECRNVAGEKNNGRKDGRGCQKHRWIIGPNLKQ